MVKKNPHIFLPALQKILHIRDLAALFLCSDSGLGDGMAGHCRAIRRTAGEEEAEGGIVNGGGENEIGMWEFLLGQGIVNANDLIEVLSSNFFVGNEDAESGEEEEEEGEVRSWEEAQDSEFDERSVFLIYIMIIC